MNAGTSRFHINERKIRWTETTNAPQNYGLRDKKIIEPTVNVTVTIICGGAMKNIRATTHSFY